MPDPITHENTLAEIDDLKARLAALERERDEALKWKAAVQNAAVVSWTLSAENENDPIKAVNDLLCWTQQVALDPAVSAEAKSWRARNAALERERDQGYRLAKHYESVALKIATRLLPHDDDGAPCFAGRSVWLHLLDVPDRIAALEARNAALVEAVEGLREHCVHNIDCETKTSPRMDGEDDSPCCTCGLDAALARAEAAVKGGK